MRRAMTRPRAPFSPSSHEPPQSAPPHRHRTAERGAEIKAGRCGGAAQTPRPAPAHPVTPISMSSAAAPTLSRSAAQVTQCAADAADADVAGIPPKKKQIARTRGPCACVRSDSDDLHGQRSAWIQCAPDRRTAGRRACHAAPPPQRGARARGAESTDAPAHTRTCVAALWGQKQYGRDT